MLHCYQIFSPFSEGGISWVKCYNIVPRNNDWRKRIMMHRPGFLKVSGVFCVTLWLLVLCLACGHAAELAHSRIFSFAHFLTGNSGLSPRGCSLNGMIWKYRMKEDLKENAAVTELHKLIRRLAEGCSSHHQFECDFYAQALKAADIKEFGNYLFKPEADNHLSRAEFDRCLADAFRQFQACFYPDGKYIDAEISKLGRSETFSGFSRQVEQQQKFFGLENEPLELVVVPVYASAEELKSFRSNGGFNIFGLSLGRIQMIEVPVIKGAPEITSRGVQHLNAVALHEINHYFYYLALSRGLIDLDMLNATPTGSARLAAGFFAETLATACGNGMAADMFRSDDPQWYDDHVINALGHEVFPLTRSYLGSSRKIDNDYLRNYLAAFDRLFPDAREVTRIAFTRFHLRQPDNASGSADLHKTLHNAISPHVPAYRSIEKEAADIQTMTIVLLTKPQLVQKGSAHTTGRNLLFRRLCAETDQFAVFAPGNDRKPATLFCIYNSESGLAELIAEIVGRRNFVPIMKKKSGNDPQEEKHGN